MLYHYKIFLDNVLLIIFMVACFQIGGGVSANALHFLFLQLMKENI